MIPTVLLWLNLKHQAVYLFLCKWNCHMTETNKRTFLVPHFLHQVDKIVEQLQQFVQSYDLAALRDYWNYLDRRLFSRLEDVYRPTVNKLKTSLFRYYLIYTVQVYISPFVLKILLKWCSFN